MTRGKFQATAAPPPAPGFRLVRYFPVASLAAFLLVAAPLLYFEFRESDFFKQVAQEQSAFFKQGQDDFAQQHDAAAHADLLSVHEAGNVNLTRLFANALWEKDFAPFVVKAQRIPVDQCRAIADVKDADHKTVPPDEKQACYAGVGKQIMAFPEFRALDAKVFDTMKKRAVLKIKVYDLRGITVYSSEHNQIGEDKLGNAGWESAVAGKPASELIHRDKFNAFDRVVENRDLIESYVPVLALGSDKIAAVFEVYSDVTQFPAQIKNTSTQIQKLSAENRAKVERAAAANHDQVDANTNLLHAIVLGLLALFYIALFLIVRHGQRIIDKQDFERKRAELALLRQKDLYDVLSQSNKAIVRIVGRDELFATVCRVAVEHGRFRFAWVGLIDNDDQWLKPVARYGEDAGYIDQLDVSGDGASALRRGLTGRTLLSGANVISNDFLNDPEKAPWCEAARRAGVRASAKFPIREGGAVVGAINLYAGEPGFFTEELVATLDEMTNDVSFALDNYVREAARKQAAEALRASEAKFRSLAEEDLAGVVIIQDGRFKYVNPAIARMLGYSREELLGASSVLEVVADEDRTLVRENLRRRQDGEVRSMGYTFRARNKDGSPVYLEVFGTRIPFECRFAVMATVLDITDRKQAEETQAKLAAIVESSNDAIIGRALDGTVTSWNAAAERILGYTAAEIIGRDPVEIFPPLLQQQIAEYRKLVRAGQTVPSHETVHIAKDGRHIDFAASLTTIKDNRGRIIGTATTLRDITERKRIEQALHDYAKRLRGLSRRLFAAAETERRNINRELHDRVGQSLSALNINLNIIRSQLPQHSLDVVGARFQDTQTLLEGTAAQIRNIMADLHPPALDDFGLLAALRTYAESSGARAAVPIAVHGEDLAPRLSLAAETALFRIAQEALANAVKHARARNIEVVLGATPECVTLTIDDDGVGFDAEHTMPARRRRRFDDGVGFDTGHTMPAGNHWGLAIMRERADAVGAALRMESAPGRGVHVIVEIPRRAA